MLKLIILCISLFFSCSDIFAVDWIKAKNGYLLNESGDKIQLKGMSTHGIAWYPNYYHYNSIKNLKEFWNTNVFRVAMYTEEWGGYISNKAIKSKVIELVEASIDLDMYVIIDWHILSDSNPLKNANESEIFFREMSERFGQYPNVIYEICNEPNSGANWWNSIKPYAERIIPVIRKNAPNSLVIVGSGNWSQDIQEPASDPLSFENVAYSLHFYSGTHRQWLRDRIKSAKNKGLTIFATEWGMSQASGNGGIYPDETRIWLDYLEKEKISWCNWSLAPKNESSAGLQSNASQDGNWSEKDLSNSGKWVRNYLISHR